MAIGVGEYFPQSHYGGGIPGAGSFQQQELSNIYGQSYDMTQMSLSAFKNFLGEAQKVTESYKGRIGILEVQAERLRGDLLNAPSLVQQQVKEALDRNMKNQATVAASLHGPVARVNALLMSKNAQQTHDMAVSGVAEFIKEDIARKSMYWQQISQNNQQAIQALGGLSQAQMNGMNITSNMSTSALRTALDAGSALATYRTNAAQQEIQRDQLQNQWNQSLLDSETNIALSTMDQMGGTEQAIIRAQASTQSSYLNAWSRAYATTKQHEAAIYRTQMNYGVDMYRTNQNALLQRELAENAAQIDLLNIDANQQIAELNYYGNPLYQLMNMENANVQGGLNRAHSREMNAQAQANANARQMDALYMQGLMGVKDGVIDAL